MLNIRLSRVGKKGYAQYRVVVAEKSAPIKGKFVEQIGSYNPHTKDASIKKDRVEYWISKGAACSDSVYNLLVENKIIEGDKRKLALKKKKGAEEEEAAKVENKENSEKKVVADDASKDNGDAATAETTKKDDAKTESVEKADTKSEEKK